MLCLKTAQPRQTAAGLTPRRHGAQRKAISRAICRSAAVRQLEQAQHCVTPVGHQLAFLACRSNGLSHLFEDTARSALEDLTAAAASREDDLQQSKSMTSPSFGDSLTAVLQRQVQATREEAQQRTAEEILYLWCLHRLANKGITLSNSLLPEESTPGKQEFVMTEDMLTRIMSPALVEMITTTLGATFRAGEEQCKQEGVAANEVLFQYHRTDAARFYAGFIEIAYHAREMEVRCRVAHRTKYTDMAQLMQVMQCDLAGLPRPQLRARMRVKSQPAWRAAVRHTGLLYELESSSSSSSLSHTQLSFSSPAEGDAAPAVIRDDNDPTKQQSSAESMQDTLPYPQLEQTGQLGTFGSPDALAEHFNPPGAAEQAASSAASKQSRGWKVNDTSRIASLPEWDELSLTMDRGKQLQLEAVAFGCMLWECEKAVRKTGYPLQPFIHNNDLD